MKLTDANKIRDYVKEQINPYGKPFDGSAYEFGLKIMNYIDNMSADYDIDKVVEELDCDRCESCSFLKVCAGSICCRECHKKAIEIVKQSSVSDNVCEWKIDGDMAINPHNLSRYKIKQYDGLYMLDTCHHCRKKIKVVE